MLEESVPEDANQNLLSSLVDSLGTLLLAEHQATCPSLWAGGILLGASPMLQSDSESGTAQGGVEPYTQSSVYNKLCDSEEDMSRLWSYSVSGG